ncbi:hypothetical protein [Cellulomonas sp. ES6]|uniref:hypothetical protein n=1 Tax=Cellulomonas sp. ES6 TaxID=3039384 RepID=UPI0024B75547|nr:hypothetical protein [Cellulomonas sp. ES6]WHP17198.1 hypothetical protein P9841_16680 [Cellulomonas sp. ES6]
MNRPRTLVRTVLLRVLLPVLAAAAVLVTGLAGLGGDRGSAAAADLTQFDPGMIISDAVFYDSGTMSAAQVQSFLNQKGASCVPTAGNTCLKDYRQATTSRPADAYCRAYSGSSSETAAQIVAKVAVACRINPQVLLVTLQKEQGLVTATAGKPETTYRKALGFGCPDTRECDAKYFGFGNQVYLAARQFQRYAAEPGNYTHRAGIVNQVRFHPNAACGTSPVLIQNQATASLYNYTPYQPNAAALRAGYGTGDSCSSYGNRNFWNYFSDWFGSPTQRAPIGVVEQVTSPSSGRIAVSGWALDPDTTASIRVHVHVDGKPVQSVAADRNRPDVGSAYGKGSAHGFSTTVDSTSGKHRVCVYAIDSAGGANSQLGCRDVTVVNQPPIGRLDQVTSPSAGTVQVSGWALDPDTAASIRVHVHLDGKPVRSAAATASRPDVGRAYGKGSAHGFTTSFPAAAGRHEVCLYAIDSSGGANTKVSCRTVDVQNARPIGRVDTATSVEGRLRVTGWALDPDTSASIRVHVHVDGKPARSVAADGLRPDVDRAYGKGAAHGYSVDVAATPGTHEVCVYAIDPVVGPNPKIGCRTATVVNQAPTGAVEAVTPGAGQFTVEGWVHDPDTTGPVTVRVSVDGKAATSVVADLDRPDVASRLGTTGSHGFRVTIPVTAGDATEHRVCVDGVDTWGGPDGRVGCATGVANVKPIGRLDSATVLDTGAVRVKGWALDPNTTAPIRVHVYVDGTAVKALTADVSRPDVDRAYGMGALHGYSTTLDPLTSGTHTVCTYAIDSFGASQGGTNPRIGCKDVSVP